MSGDKEAVVLKDELHSFVVRSMEAVGLKPDRGSVLADLLVSADYRGHYSHGLNRLGNKLFSTYSLYKCRLHIIINFIILCKNQAGFLLKLKLKYEQNRAS